MKSFSPRFLARPCLLAALLLAAGPAAPFLRGQSATPAKPASLPFAKEIEAFAASDKTNPPPTGAILFIGSSSIRLWTNLAADFPRHRVINRGFGGSQIIDSDRKSTR